MTAQNDQGEVIDDITPYPTEQSIPQYLRPESVRGILAFSVPILLILLFITTFVGANFGNWANTKEAYQITAPILSLFIGGIIGFFFGNNSQ